MTVFKRSDSNRVGIVTAAFALPDRVFDGDVGNLYPAKR